MTAASDDWHPGRREPKITRRMREWYLWWVTSNVLYGFERANEPDHAELEVFVVEWYTERLKDYLRWTAADVYRGGAYPSAEWIVDKKAFWEDFPRALAAAKKRYVDEQRARTSGKPCPPGPIDVDAALAAVLGSTPAPVREPPGHYFLTNPREYLRHMNRTLRRRQRAAGRDPSAPFVKECIACGDLFDSPHPAIVGCPECRTKKLRTCTECDRDFPVDGRAKRCPSCRQKKGQKGEQPRAIKRQPRREA